MATAGELGAQDHLGSGAAGGAAVVEGQVEVGHLVGGDRQPDLGVVDGVDRRQGGAGGNVLADVGLLDAHVGQPLGRLGGGYLELPG